MGPKLTLIAAITLFHVTMASKHKQAAPEQRNCGDECSFYTPFYDPRFAVPNVGSFYDWPQWEKYVLETYFVRFVFFSEDGGKRFLKGDCPPWILC